VLKPGGMFEMCDVAEHTFPSPYISEWSECTRRVQLERNIDFWYINTIAERLPSYGPWTIVSSRTVQIPAGQHGGELGQLMSQDIEQMLQPSLRFGGITDEHKVQEYAKNILREFDENEFFIPFMAVVARKTQA